MSKAQLESWLSRDDDYNEGLSLYIRFGKSDFLKDLFSKGETTFNRTKLRKEIILLCEQLPEETEKTKSGSAVTDDEYSRMPPEGKELQKQWKSWYAEMNALRHQLLNPMTEKVRHEMALKIIKLDGQVRGAWGKIDYWRKYGEFPGEIDSVEELKSLSVIELVKRKNNLSTYISKFQNDSSKSDKLVQWKTEQLQIQNILDGLI